MIKIPRAFIGWEVLVIDDESDNLEVASRLLRLGGATVVVASDGQQALEIVRTHPTLFKVILSDLSMPAMDGWEVLYLLKQDPRMQPVPVIALTAHAMQGDRERGLAAGFHNYITKPIDPTRFIQQLITILIDIPEYAEHLKTF